MRVLRLQGNQLTGPVPPGLGRLIWLEELDLAGNPLTGCLTAAVRARCPACPDLPACPAPPAEPPPCPARGPSPSLECDLEILLGLRDALRGPATTLFQDWQPQHTRPEGLESVRVGSFPPAILTLPEGFAGVEIDGDPLRVLNLRIGADRDADGPAPGGVVPPALGRLPWLQVLSIVGQPEEPEHQLGGTLPPELGQLRNLDTLHLRHNRLTGPIPPELAHLPRLETLHLDGNALTGCLPAAWQDRFRVTTRTGGEPRTLPYCPD